MLPSPATDILVNRPAEEEQRSVQVQVEGAGTAIVPAPTQTTSTGTAAERKRGARGRGSKRNRSTAETVTTEGGEVDSAPETTHAAPAGNAFRIPKRPPPTLDEVQWRQRQAQARSYRGANRHLSQESQQLLREELRVFHLQPRRAVHCDARDGRSDCPPGQPQGYRSSQPGAYGGERAVTRRAARGRQPSAASGAAGPEPRQKSGSD